MKLAVCDDSEKALQLMSCKSSLEHIIVIEKISDEARNKATELNFKLISFKELTELGRKNIKKPIVIMEKKKKIFKFYGKIQKKKAIIIIKLN